ncbi:hypothetical protein LQ384_28875 [Rhodococcus rhodochrous]|uniref:DUF2335 domain-containing protein n=1 Tax=Rhodococcus rhodochrous TaxID=1829 RepID=A0AAW4XN51_RHORH|nr:hypothetical protein [Rhodococcus rhodochrous]MCD2115088.1 hypothetical protein [Rhodococcus rhodochrous]
MTDNSSREDGTESPDRDEIDYTATLAEVLRQNNQTFKDALGPGLADVFAQANTMHVLSPEVSKPMLDLIAGMQPSTIPSFDFFDRLPKFKVPSVVQELQDQLSKTLRPSGASAIQQFLDSVPPIKYPKVEMPALDPKIYGALGPTVGADYLANLPQLTAITDPDGKLAALTESIRLQFADTSFQLPSISKLVEAYETSQVDTGAFAAFVERVEADDDWKEAIDIAVDRIKPPLISRRYVRRLVIYGAFLVVGSVIVVLCMTQPLPVVSVIAGIGVGGKDAKEWAEKQLDKRWPIEDEAPDE